MSIIEEKRFGEFFTGLGEYSYFHCQPKLIFNRVGNLMEYIHNSKKSYTKLAHLKFLYMYV